MDGPNPTPASCEQLGLSELSPGNSCYFTRTNRQQNFDFLIGGVINLPLKLELSLCTQVESLTMDPTRCSA